MINERLLFIYEGSEAGPAGASLWSQCSGGRAVKGHSAVQESQGYRLRLVWIPQQKKTAMYKLKCLSSQEGSDLGPITAWREVLLRHVPERVTVTLFTVRCEAATTKHSSNYKSKKGTNRHWLHSATSFPWLQQEHLNTSVYKQTQHHLPVTISTPPQP